MTYTLVVVIGILTSNGSAHVHMHDFSSKERCEQAKEDVMRAIEKVSGRKDGRGGSAFCILK